MATTFGNLMRLGGNMLGTGYTGPKTAQSQVGYTGPKTAQAFQDWFKSPEFKQRQSTKALNMTMPLYYGMAAGQGLPGFAAAYGPAAMNWGKQAQRPVEHRQRRQPYTEADVEYWKRGGVDAARQAGARPEVIAQLEAKEQANRDWYTENAPNVVAWDDYIKGRGPYPYY